MSDHKPECVLSDPCSADEPRHGYCGFSVPLHCIHCEEWCDCDRIKRAEDRVRAEHDEYRAMLGGIDFGAERSWDYALDAAREAVLAAMDFGREARFTVDVRDDALAAIDALKEKP